MNANTATIRELRTDFRSVKRRIEQHGEVIVTDHGEPAYVIKLQPAPPKKRAPLPDYYARLRKRQRSHGLRQATPKPPQSHIKAPTKRVDSQGIGTSKPHQGSTKATTKLRQGSTKATPWRRKSVE